jgi:hypothetical protein
MVSPQGSQLDSAERRLMCLENVLPKVPHSLGAYVEAVQSGRLLFTETEIPSF